jgi:type I restriction enzyme S subunit
MVVEKGYKQTEVGVIPEEWIFCEFQEVMTGFSSGQTPYREIKRYYTGEIPWITSGELNYNVITDTFEKISSEAVRRTNLKIIPKGTFLFAITGLEAAGTRGSCGITGIEATSNQSCMALYPIPGKLITEYLFHFYVKNGDLLAFKYCQGTKQQSYTAAIAKKLPIAIPKDISEQTAIANALSDMDALIAQTSTLIEKKKAIKQGVMQELLKPKAGWVTRKLGEVGKCLRGVSYNPEIDLHKFSDSTNFSLLRSNNIFEGLLELNNLQFVNKMKVKDFQVVKDSDIIICMANGSKQLVGKSAIADNIEKNRYTYGAFMGCFRTLNSYNPKFVFFLMQSKIFRNYIDILLSGSSINNLNPSNIESISFAFPDLNTQNEITEVIDAYSKELKSLNLKLQKLKLQKQGMMQALLTGKIRLV